MSTLRILFSLVALLPALGAPIPTAPTPFEPPPGYYDGVDTTNAATLRYTLHALIDDHTYYPRDHPVDTDVWDVLEAADEDPNDPSKILDVYRNASYAKAGGSNADYVWEHAWPSEYGFPQLFPEAQLSSRNYPYNDAHHVFLADEGYSVARAVLPFATCDAACTEHATELNNGKGGGSGTYPGNSNWSTGAGASGSWEVWVDKRGDIARALFYLDVRYEGDQHGSDAAHEPNLKLTDDRSLIVATAENVQLRNVAYMGLLSVLLQWHVADPVDDAERARHEVVFGFQGNRNPFIDNPDWVDLLFNGPRVAGHYVLDGFGGVHVAGTAAPLVPAPPYFGFDIAVDLELTATGAYVLDGFGGVHAAGGAAPITGPTPYFGFDIARDMELGSTGFYVLDGFGGVHAGNGAPLISPPTPYFGFDIANDLELAPGGYYVLDGYGGIHTGGTADVLIATDYFPARNLVIDMELAPTGFYWMPFTGSLEPYAGAPRMTTTNGLGFGWDVARDFELAPDGFYLLDGWGGVHVGGGSDPVMPATPYFGFDIARDLELR